MGLFDFVKNVLRFGISIIDKLLTFVNQFLDAALAFLHGPITLNSALVPLFSGVSGYAIYGLYTVALVAFGFMVARIIVHLL